MIDSKVHGLRTVVQPTTHWTVITNARAKITLVDVHTFSFLNSSAKDYLKTTSKSF